MSRAIERIRAALRPTVDAPTPRETGAVPIAALRDLAHRLRGIRYADYSGELTRIADHLALSRPDAASASVTEADVVTSRILKGTVGRDKCVDVAMDYIDNNITHEEECASHGRDTEGDRHDCNCYVRAGLEELERIARLAAAPRDAGREDTARLDWLESEYEREQMALVARQPLPKSLFRQNNQITRAAIDAARRGVERRVLCGNCGNHYTAPTEEAEHGIGKCSDLRNRAARRGATA